MKENGFKISDGTTTDTVKLTETVTYKGDSNIVTTVTDNQVGFKLANSITVGPATGGHPVKIDGNAGTVTGLTNKTWNPASITSGRAATEDQLKAAQAAATSKVTAGDGITVTPSVDNTTGSTTYQVAADTTSLTVSNGKVTPPAAGNANKLVKAGDIADAINNSGFQATAGGNLASGSTATATTVKPGQKVTFAAGDGLTVKQDLDANGDQSYTYALNAQSVVQSAQTPVVYTKADGSKVYKHSDGNFYDKPEGQPGAQQVQPGDVIASMQNADGTTTSPTTLANVKGNLADTTAATTNPANNDRTTLTANGKGNNAATVNDVLNAGFTVQGNGVDKDFVTHGDTINFADGQGTVAKVNTTGGVTKVQFDTPMTYVDPAGSATSTPSNKVKLVGGNAGAPVTLDNVADGTVAANSKEAINGGQLHALGSSTATALGGTSSFNPATGQVTAGLNVGGTTHTSVQDALNAINTTAGAGWNLKANGGTASNIAPNGTVDVVDGSNTKVTLTGNTLKVDVVNNPTFSGQVTANGGLTVGGNLTVAPGANVDMGNNVIHNVADGVADTDAANVRQLRSVSGNIVNVTKQINAVNARVTQVDNRVTNLTGRVDGIDTRVTAVTDLVGENFTNPDGTKALDVYDVAKQTMTEHTNVISALNQVKREGTKYSHTRDNGEAPIIGPTNDSSAGALGSTAQGVNAIVEPDAVNATAMGHRARVRNAAAHSVAIGNEAETGGVSAVAIGDGAQALGEKSISIGTGNVVRGDNSGAIGDPTVINAANSYSVGNNNTIDAGSHDAFVLGNNVTATAANSVHLGSGAAAQTAATPQTAGMTTYNVGIVNGVAYNYAGGTPAGVVTVGDVGQERRIQNVAAGQISPTSTDAINGSQLYQTTTAISGLSNKIDANHNKAMGGVASAMASAGLPQAYVPGKSMVAMGAATYQGRTALALGVSTISDNGRWVLKGSVNTHNHGTVGANVGVGYQW